MLLDRYQRELAAVVAPATLVSITGLIHRLESRTLMALGPVGITSVIDQYLNSKIEFIRHLPGNRPRLGTAALRARNQQVPELRALLHQAGLLNAP